MEDNNNLNGYDTSFLPVNVPLPVLNPKQQLDCVRLKNSDETVINYINYSLQLSASRAFPFFTATNIDGDNFKKAPRKDGWRKDNRVPADAQWGVELYQAAKSEFDKGHMTKREDVQWGESIAVASKAAESTFFYTNAVPQYSKLNQQIWRSLEDYILHTEARKYELRISVFTGPVLSAIDPWFVTEVKGKRIQIPTLFWKLVVFPDRNGELKRVGFLMSQASLLLEHGIVEEPLEEAFKKDEQSIHELFMEYEKAATYQVNVHEIEALTGMIMPEARDIYFDKRPIELVLEEVDIKESLKESANVYEQLGFRINGIQL